MIKPNHFILTLALLPGWAKATPVDDNLIIIGARTPISVEASGHSISIIDREQIEQRQVLFAARLLQDVPGFSVSHAGGLGAQTQLRVRGAEANHVQVLIDGVEANDIASGDEFRFAHLSTFDIERIEVVRGPQSALWGSDALAGVINIVTRRSRDAVELDAYADAGAFDSRSLGVRAGSAGSAGHVGAAVSWVDSDGTNIARTGDEDDAYENLTVSLRGGTTLIHDALSIEALLRHTDTTRNFDAFDFLTGLQNDADRESDARQTYAGLRFNLDLNQQAWRQSLQLGLTDTEDENREAGGFDSSTAGEKLGIYYQSSFFFDGPRGSEQTLTLAVDHENEDFEQRGIFGPFGDPNRNDDLDNTGYVVEYLVQPFERLALAIALRHDDNSDFDNVTTYRASASYRIGETGMRLRASAGTGQKSPTFTERFGFFSPATSNFVGNPDLKPEKSEGYEIGIDQRFGEGSRLSLTYFNERLDDEIDGFFITDPLSFAATAVNRDGTSHRRGVEISTTLRPVEALGLIGQYTYTHADTPDGNGGETAEIRRPRHSASLNLNYAFLGGRGNANLNVSYTGDQFDSDFSAFPAARVELDGYTLVDLAASYAVNDTVDVYARVENLTDEDYENVYGFATPGIGAYAGVRMRFRR